MIKTSTCRGRAGFSDLGEAGEPSASRRSVPIKDGMANGAFPVTIMNSTLPRAKRSARASTDSPRACSGDMYSGVPAPRPVWVRRASSAARARPKSVRRTPSDGDSSRMFAGFTSRWTSPFSWAAPNASAVSSAIRNASAVGIVPSRSRRCCSDSPCTNGITSTGTPAYSSTASTGTTFGWVIDAAARPSRRNRPRATGSPRIDSVGIFNATVRRSTTSCPCRTIPMPPRPTTPRTS